MKLVPLVGALLVAVTAVGARAADDAAYGEQIRRETTEPRFATELLDHLPASATVPSPLADHGYIAGAEGHLTYTADVAKYMRALAAASPRVKVMSIGKSEEGREMIAVAIADEATLADLDRYREITRRLADPRRLTAEAAKGLIAEGKPIYLATGAMHSPETGSPEMLMELAYRLAVEETPTVQAIRSNVITLLIPVIEVDGRDRQVDLWNYRQAHPDVPTPPLVYWGHYVAHDNNRDQIGMALALSRNVSKAYFDFHPQVVHDLHESIPFLYVSTGTGPYNPALDPLVIDEQHRMAYHEVDELTARGLPGVWTHGFYDGWAPNYMFWVGLGHNSIGRFYETFGNSWPITAQRVIRGMSDRAWYRPNPPLPTVSWSLRDNVNFQQSGLLLALSDMAAHRERFLERFYQLGQRSIAKATTEGPAAWVFEGDQKRQGQLADLLAVLARHGVEVQQTDQALTIDPLWPPVKPPKDDEAAPSKPPEARSATATKAGKTGPGDKEAGKDAAPTPIVLAKGSFVVRMDQPYSRLADTLLDVQYVRGDEKVYDDTGWTLGYLKNVSFHRVVNPEILKARMHPWSAPPAAAVANGPLAITNAADVDLARLRFAAPGARLLLTEATFKVGKVDYPAGTVLADGAGLGEALATLHLTSTAVGALPEVASHALATPRIGLIHSWLDTQNEGWWRLGLESLGVPYTYLSTQDVAATPNLRQAYDVLLFPPIGEDLADVVDGLPPGPPLPWRSTPLTPNLGGVDETDDLRPGLGLEGLTHLRQFVEQGGLLITAADTSELAVRYGLTRFVEKVDTEGLKAPGTIVLASVTDAKSPVTTGYDATLPVYFAGGPVFKVGVLDERKGGGRPSGRGGKDDPDVAQGRPFVATPEKPKPAAGDEGFVAPDDAPWFYEAYLPRKEDRPRVLVSFAKEDELFLSGMLEGGDQIVGKPAVILAPRGQGHVLLMSVNPMWRANTQGQYALVMNAIMSWDHLASAP
jgi:hypothetical protein